MSKEDDAPVEEVVKLSLVARLSEYKSWFQVAGLIVLLLMLMTTSIVTGLMVTGVININEEKKQVVGNMGDAMSICDSALQEEHGELMQAFALDDLSSHGDQESGGYKLYYEMNMYRDVSRQTGVKKFFVNCFVSAGGRIKRMDLFEDKSFIPKAVKRTSGNVIGL